MSPGQKKKVYREHAARLRDRLKLLVARLLEWPKPKTSGSSKETANLSDSLNQIERQIFFPGIGNKIQSQPNQIKIPPEILETALSNLATNSLQHEATRVELGHSEKPIMKSFWICRITGGAFPRQTGTKYSLLFSPLTGENGGTGLGLRIVQTLLESHSGKSLSAKLLKEPCSLFSFL